MSPQDDSFTCLCSHRCEKCTSAAYTIRKFARISETALPLVSSKILLAEKCPRAFKLENIGVFLHPVSAVTIFVKYGFSEEPLHLRAI